VCLSYAKVSFNIKQIVINKNYAKQKDTKLGFNKFFLKNINESNGKDLKIARVINVYKNSYLMSDGNNIARAQLLGKIIYSASSSADYPITGDWVLANFYDDNKYAIIHQILPRKSLLQRKTAGTKNDCQLIAANVDIAFIIQSLDDNFNLNRLERYLVMVHQSNIKPIVLFSKSDLLSKDDIKQKTTTIKTNIPKIDVITFNNKKTNSWSKVSKIMQTNFTYCLLGSSGVGKTSLLNNLVGKNEYLTCEVSKKDNKGKHTTTNRQLVKLANGSIVIDTPGMRELANIFFSMGIKETFMEITELAKKCKFNNCSHIVEKGCAVLAAVKNGLLSDSSYQNFIKIKKESEFNKMSYLEKRKKDKQFGKYCKSIMKHKRQLKHR
jgi:ribosome biogenesis GTPase / thiamine phosphate phosphatase